MGLKVFAFEPVDDISDFASMMDEPFGPMYLARDFTDKENAEAFIESMRSNGFDTLTWEYGDHNDG